MKQHEKDTHIQLLNHLSQDTQIDQVNHPIEYEHQAIMNRDDKDNLFVEMNRGCRENQREQVNHILQDNHDKIV